MTVIFRLSDGTTTVDLQTTTGPELLAEYLPAFATPTGDGTIPPYITEAIPVLVRIASDDGLASTLQDIARLGQQAALYTANRHQTPVWLSRKLTGETGGTATGVRHLVRDVSFTPNAEFGGLFDVGPAITDGRIGVLSVTHHPYGEATTAVAASGTDSVSVLGGAVNYTDVTGDVPARLYYLNVDDMANATTIYQIWAGFRSDAQAGGDASLVNSLWEVEAGTPGTDASETTDATASPGGAGNTKTRVTFATQTGWFDRASILMSDETANESAQTGAFVVLLRAKVNQGTAQIKLRQLGVAAGVYRDGPVVDVAATSWTLYNLGTVEFPIRDLHAVPIALFADSYDQTDRLQIWGRVKPGSASTPDETDLDCLILIPCDEYFIHLQTATGSMTDDDIMVFVAPEDVPQAINVDDTSNYFNNACPVSTIGAGIPVGDGRLFVATANDDSGAAPGITATVNVELSYYPRWVHFRGSE